MVARAPRIIRPQDGERELHQHRACDIGQDGAGQDARAGGAERADRLDIFVAAGGQHLGVGDAGEAGQEQQRQHHDQRAGAGAEQSDDQQRQQDRREAQHDIHAAHCEHRADATKPAADQAEDGAEHAGDGGRGERHDETGAGTPDQPRQNIPAELVTAQQVAGDRAGEAVGDVLAHRVGQAEPGRQHGQ
jgi:hypothetical protein